MRNKSISLCDKSFEVAKRMPNFSGWIREQLLAYQPKVEVKVEVNKRHTNKHNVCKNCGAIGQHWTLDCPTLGAVE